MAWTNWPPVNGTTDIQAYDWLRQLWFAVRERQWAVGTEHWPRPNLSWETGTIESLSDNGDGTYTLTDSTKDWEVVSPASGTSRWVGYTVPDAPYIPSSYDVVIDDADPTKVVRGQISASTATTLTLSSATIADAITGGFIDDVASLEGKKYAIVKRGGLWWSERWFQWPNDLEYAKGTASSATTSTLTLTDAGWGVDDFTGMDLLVRDTDSVLHRVAIAGNTADTLSFATQSWTSSGSFIVLASGGVGIPGRRAPYPFWFYGGAVKAYYGHYPDDQLLSVQMPTATVTFSEGTTTDACADSTKDAMDKDVWSIADNVCSEADKCYSPNLFKTLRQLQVDVEDICTSFVPVADYDGAAAIPLYTPATLFHAADINSGTATVEGPSDLDDDEDTPEVYYFEPASTYEGLEVVWTILDTNSAPVDSGTGTVTDGKVDIGSTQARGTLTDISGASVVYSARWTRYLSREFAHLYSRTAFLPDTDEGAAIDPPAVQDHDEFGCFGVGKWIRKDASTDYKIYSNQGFAGEGGGAFVEGQLARYTGDNWHDPDTTVHLAVTSPDDPLAPYWDHFFEGVFAKDTQAGILSDRAGTVTSGTSNSLTDSSKSWWGYWYGGGTLRTEEGTATSGSSTTLVDTAKIVHDGSECFWQADRFVNFSSPWAGFILEVDHGGVTYKVPIISGDADTGTLTFAAVTGLTVAAGDAYRIKEPKYNLNRFEGRRLTITKADGTTLETVITHNDDTTLWFADVGTAVEADWTYAITEYYPGGTWQWTTTEPSDGVYQASGDGWWIAPTGDDPRGQPFHKNQNENLPTAKKAYGRLRKADYITGTLFQELYNCINLLRWTKHTGAWQGEIHWTGTGTLTGGSLVDDGDGVAGDGGDDPTYILIDPDGDAHAYPTDGAAGTYTFTADSGTALDNGTYGFVVGNLSGRANIVPMDDAFVTGDWAEAVAFATTDSFYSYGAYSASTGTPPIGVGGDPVVPTVFSFSQAVVFLTFEYDDSNDSVEDVDHIFRLSLNRTRSYAKASMPQIIDCDMDFFARAVAYHDGTFDANSDGPPWSEDVYKSFQTVEDCKDRSLPIRTDLIGDTAATSPPSYSEPDFSLTSIPFSGFSGSDFNITPPAGLAVGDFVRFHNSSTSKYAVYPIFALTETTLSVGSFIEGWSFSDIDEIMWVKAPPLYKGYTIDSTVAIAKWDLVYVD